MTGGVLNLGFKPKAESATSSDSETPPIDVASILEEGASQAEPEHSGEDLAQAQEQIPTPGFPVELNENGEPKRKRGRPRKIDSQPSELDLFFSPQGIGQLWVNGWNSFYYLCGAPPLTAEETEMHKRVFSAWCKARMPAEASKYQPDILLAATVAMSTLPRMAPIAKTTAPLWRRAWNRLRGKSSE